MDTSIFTDKKKKPAEADLEQALGATYKLWFAIRNHVLEKYPKAMEEWNFPGEKYGWSFRIKDTKRVIIYLLPRDKYFKVAFVFGQKATDLIMESNISTGIKNELASAKSYAEGRGIRIEVKKSSILNDIKTLIGIKISTS